MPTVRFSRYVWDVKLGRDLGPGPNTYAAANVRVGDIGLHLRVDRAGDRWRCAEVSTRRSMGHGTYTFDVEGPIDRLDPNVVLGLFTYRSDLSELDIEYSRWGWERAKGGQFACQPFATKGNRFRFAVRLDGSLSRNSIDWRPHQVTYSSVEIAEDGSVVRPIALRVYTGDDIPKASTEHCHVNLWLYRGEPPTDGETVTITVRRFRFTPFPR